MNEKKYILRITEGFQRSQISSTTPGSINTGSRQRWTALDKISSSKLCTKL